MRWIIACSLGVGAVSLFPELPSLLWLSPVALLGLVCAKYKPFKIIAALCFGLLWGLIYGWQGLQHQLPEAFENIDLNATGQIVGLPRTAERKQRFDFKLESLSLPNGEALYPPPKWIRINWYQTEKPVLPGETWQFVVRLKRPHGFASPGAFDFETWLFQRGIGATGYVREGNDNHKTEGAGARRPLDQIRFSLYRKLKQITHQYRYSAVLTALLMGERADIDDRLWDTFTRTGTNHLFVISGLHVGLVALCAYLLVMRIGRWVPLGTPAIAMQQVAAFCALWASAGYSALAGFGLPTQRALIMLALLLLGKILKRQVNMGVCFLTALLLVLLLDPLAPRAVGFWLSFGAVGVLLLGFSGYSSHQGIWWRWGRPQWLVFVSFIPLLLYFFNQFSLVSPMANLIAIPVVGMLVVPLCLLGGSLLFVNESFAGWLLQGADRLVAGLMVMLDFLARSELAIMQCSPNFSAVLWAVFGALLLLAPRGLPGRWLAIFFFMPLFVGEPSVKPGEYSVSLFDVGQGLSVLVETNEHRLLYDVGPAYDDNFNTASSVLLPYFQQRTIRWLDRIIISHSDSDHAGSLPYLANRIGYGDIVSGSVLAKPFDINTMGCQSGLSWQWDGVTFQLMQASREYWNSQNNRSCVLKIDNGEFSVLLTGDIEREAEISLINQFDTQLQADFLLAPHHGSRTSSSRRFIQQVSPSWVAFTMGYKNRFGHPKPDIVERYRQRHIKILDTVSSGTIKLSVSSQNQPIKVESYRATQLGYWY